MIAYDPREMSWSQYNQLMAELFAPQHVGFVAENDWRSWVDSLNGIGYFAQSGIPDQRQFLEWKDWAIAMCGIMSVTHQ